MKRRGGGTCLGLAFGERSIAVAEVNAGRGEATVVRTGTFALVDATLAKPADVGAALKKFLRDNGFGASRAVVGLPARWVMARERQVPPAAPAAAAALLRLQAERAFPPELKDLTYDYAGKADSGKATTVLLVAAARSQVDRAAEVARAAGLTPLAVTSTSLALAAALADGHGSNILVSVADDATELVVSVDGNPRTLRHLPVSGAQLVSGNGTSAVGLATLGGELFRAATLGGAGGAVPELVLWNGVGLRTEALEAIGQRAGLTPAPLRDLSRLNVRGVPAGDADPARFGAAVALALAGVRPELIPVDFLASRLAPVKKRRLGRKAAWGVAAAVLLVGGIGWAAVDLRRQEADLAAKQAELARLQPDVKAAEALSAKVALAAGWFDMRPSALECAKRITESFPAEGSVWATNFTLRDNGKGTVAGKAADARELLAVYDRLKNDPNFTEVNLNWRESGGNSRDISFTISFTFNEGR